MLTILLGFENPLEVYSCSKNETLQTHFNLQYYFQAIIKVKFFIFHLILGEKKITGAAQLCPLFSQALRHKDQWLLLVYVTQADAPKKSQVLLYMQD